MYGLFGHTYRIATLSTFYLTVLGIEIDRTILKQINQKNNNSKGILSESSKLIGQF